MRIYKPSVVTIRVMVSHGEYKVKFTVIESELDELFTLAMNEFKGLTERTTGLRISGGVKVCLRESAGTVNMGERTVNVYGVSTDLVVERLISAVNEAECDEIVEKARSIIRNKQ